MSTNATSDDRPRGLSRRTLDVLGCILCLMILTLASGWMLVQAGIGQAAYPLRVSTSSNRELNALLVAIELNDVPAARRVLRKQRLDVNMVDDAGVPAINYALRARGPIATELVGLLIAAGADVNGRGTDNFATLPLLDTATLGRPDLVERLLEAGADVGATCRNGWTALHFAAAYDHPQTVAVLLAAGADPDAADDEGDNPLAVALAHGSSSTAALLAHRARALTAACPDATRSSRRAVAAYACTANLTIPGDLRLRRRKPATLPLYEKAQHEDLSR